MTEIEEVEPTEGPEKGLHLLFIDGGKKANPSGEDEAVGAIAAILKDPDGKKVIAEASWLIGPVPDPHVAEYKALMAGLELAKESGVKYLAVFSDSRTVVNQVNQLWKRNASHLAALHSGVYELLATFPHCGVQLSWIPREWNEEADDLVRNALRGA